MTESVNVRRIYRKFLYDVFVRLKLIDKPPLPDLIDREPSDLNCALLAQNRERPLKVGGPRGSGCLDNSQRAVPKFECSHSSVFGFYFCERGDCARMNADDIEIGRASC